MATETLRYHLSQPEDTDSFESTIEAYCNNLEIIDENLGGGGGGGGFVEMTTASYRALPDVQKLDPTKLYMLNDTPPTDIPVDFTECVSKKASRMSVNVVDDTLVWTYSGSGGQVQANSFFPTAIPKEAEKLIVSLSTGTAYNASTFEIGVGVRAIYQDTSYVYSNDSNWLAIATYNQINQNDVELEVDLSNVTDDSYLVIACFGWNVTFNSIVVKLSETPQYQTSMRYKDVPYANGQGGGGGGVVNIIGAFIDTNNVIKAQTNFYTTLTYTATEDCYVALYLVPTGATSLYIDGELMHEWSVAGTSGDGCIVPLKRGQILSITGTNSQYESYYTVYGIVQGSNACNFIRGIFASEGEAVTIDSGYCKRAKLTIDGIEIESVSAL